MIASRGMGAIAPSKMPDGKKKARRDDTDFTQYAEGGKVADKWIQNAIKKPGALRAQLGAKEGQPIPAKKLAAAAKKPGKLGQRARLAETLGKMKK
jgi:hypothetical protein